MTGIGSGRAGGGAAGPVRLYTPGEAAGLLAMRESTLREWARRGRVPHRRLGRAVRFSDADLAAIIAGALVTARAGRDTTPPVTVPAVVVPRPLPKRRRRT